MRLWKRRGPAATAVYDLAGQEEQGVSEEEVDLGVEWERWADGRPWRLKRKRDFADVHPRVVMRAAPVAASQMGKAVQTARDRILPRKYFWVQFGDHKIGLGDPCPCGCRRLLRLHMYFARCTACHAQLILSKASVAKEAEAEGAEIDDSGDGDDDLQPGTILSELTDVHLARVERVGDREVYRGHARSDGAPVLVVAEFQAGDRETLNPERALQNVASLQVVPFQHLSDLFDVSAVSNRNESEWDLVF